MLEELRNEVDKALPIAAVIAFTTSETKAMQDSKGETTPLVESAIRTYNFQKQLHGAEIGQQGCDCMATLIAMYPAPVWNLAVARAENFSPSEIPEPSNVRFHEILRAVERGLKYGMWSPVRALISTLHITHQNHLDELAELLAYLDSHLESTEEAGHISLQCRFEAVCDLYWADIEVAQNYERRNPATTEPSETTAQATESSSESTQPLGVNPFAEAVAAN